MSWQLDLGEYFTGVAEEAQNRIFTINYSYSICSNRIGFWNLMEAVSCWLSCLRDRCWNINSSLVGRPVLSPYPEKQISHGTRKATGRRGGGPHRCVDARTQPTCAQVRIWEFDMHSDYFSAPVHTRPHPQTGKGKQAAPRADGDAAAVGWCHVPGARWRLSCAECLSHCGNISSLSVWLTAAIDGNTHENALQMHEWGEGKSPPRCRLITHKAPGSLKMH